MGVFAGRAFSDLIRELRTSYKLAISVGLIKNFHNPIPNYPENYCFKLNGAWNDPHVPVKGKNLPPINGTKPLLATASTPHWEYLSCQLDRNGYYIFGTDGNERLKAPISDEPPSTPTPTPFAPPVYLSVADEYSSINACVRKNF